jgi:drug/metabolite transporter (DMT)-like permease
MMDNWKAHATLFATTIIGGLNYSISKLVMPDYFQPAAIIIIRGLSAILFFWLIHLFFIKEKVETLKDYLRLLICAFFGITANQIFFYEGLNLTSPINASLLQCAVPIFVVLISAFIIKEKITPFKIAGLILGATGAVLLLLHSQKSSISQSYTGDIMIILNGACYAVFLVLIKPLSEKYDAFTVMKWVFLFGTIMNLPYGYNEVLEVNWNTLPLFSWLSLIFIVLFATIINYSLNVGVLRYVNASVAGIYIYLIPVVTSIVAVSLNQDEVTWTKVGYSLLIFAGVFLVSKKSTLK